MRLERAYRSSGESVELGASWPRRTQRDFQDNATPDRNRFFVRRNPSGEMAMVNASPSISISRLIVLSSLVAM